MAATGLWHRILSALGLAQPASEPAPALPAGGPGAPAQERFDFDDPRIPESTRAKVARIRTLVAELEKKAVERGLIGECTELHRIRTAHLPKLLQAYIDIPAEHRAQVFRETGHSASFLLNERLDKMMGRLGEISTMLARGNLDAFTASISFIDMRYGSPDSPFD